MAAGAVLAAGVLVAYSLWPTGGTSTKAVRLRAATQSASAASSASAPQAASLNAAAQSASTASSLPAPNPAEGHSPKLQQELSGPLSGTGKTRPGMTAKVSAAVQQATSAATSTTLNGVDVSSHQDDAGAINWQLVAGAGYNFAAIKVTEGNYYTNPHYASDAASATAAGMYVSAYHFANPHDTETATAQADYAVQQAGNYKVGGKYLPMTLDIEYDPYASSTVNQCYNLSPSAMVSWISSFMTEATKLTGARPIIYTPASWWATCTGSSTAFAGDVLWVPAYSAGTPGTLPAGWKNWTMWQYTDVGAVPGITGNVDLDYFSGGPQAEQTVANASASVQIHTLNALAGNQVTYTATGLPPGLTMSSAGLIAGAPTTAGSYQVTVTPSSSAAVLPASVSFTWDVSPAPAVAVGAEGTDGHMWVQAPQLGAGWHALGGNIMAPPAVVAAPNPNSTTLAQPLFIGTGTTKQLYIRSLTVGWQPLGPKTMSCIGGAAAVITTGTTGSTLTVACRGTNNALWENTAPVTGSGLPQFTTAWTSLGGYLTAAPAVAPVGGTVTFFARGSNGHIYIRTLASAFQQMAWACLDAPAAALQAASGQTYFGCAGPDHALWEAVNAGTGWTGLVSLGGALIGGPGIAATTAAPELLIEGTNKAVWERTPTGGWTSLGGGITGGVGAAALN